MPIIYLSRNGQDAIVNVNIALSASSISGSNDSECLKVEFFSHLYILNITA